MNRINKKLKNDRLEEKLNGIVLDGLVERGCTEDHEPLADELEAKNMTGICPGCGKLLWMEEHDDVKN